MQEQLLQERGGQNYILQLNLAEMQVQRQKYNPSPAPSPVVSFPGSHFLSSP